MLNPQPVTVQRWSFMSQAELSPSVPTSLPKADLWPYRAHTVALLRRYARASVEVGRLPSLLGRECFRAKVTSYSMKNFEDLVIFVTDIERSLDRLSASDRTLLLLNVLEEYTISEASRLLRSSQRTVERQLQSALDDLSKILLEGGVLEPILF